MSGGTRAVFVRMFTPVRLDDPTPTSLVNGAALAVSGLLAQGVLRFATTLLIGRLAGQEELGVVASAIAAATILALLWPTSTGSAASKFLAIARGAGSTEDARSTAVHLRRRMVETALLLATAAIPIWVFLDGGSLAGSLTVAALTICYSGYSFTRGLQFGAGQTARATSWDLVCVVLGLTALAVMLVSGVRGVVLVLPLAAAYGLYAVAGWPFGQGVRPQRSRRRELDGFVALGAVGSLASAGFLQLSQIVVRLSSGDAGAGEYAAALSLATPASMLAVSLTLVLLPALSETLGRADDAAFRQRSDHATRSLTVIVVAIFGVIAVCSRILIQLIWGERFTGAATILAILAVAVLFSNLGVVSVNALIARSQRGMLINVAAGLSGMCVGVVIWLVAAPALGGPGVALGYLGGTLTISAIPVAVAWRFGRHRWGMLYWKVAVALALLVAIGGAQRLLNLPIAVDPILAVCFLAVWWLGNRVDVGNLPRPWSSRGR